MSSKKEWGNACWWLFHTLAYKLKEGNDDKVPELLQYMLSICSVLPCPTCSEHARTTLRGLNKNAIKSKDMLITTFIQFHNIVNKRLNKPIFSREQHDELYNRARIIPVYNNFRKAMLKAAKGERAMIYNLSRKNALNKFDKYMRNNIHIFNM